MRCSKNGRKEANKLISRLRAHGWIAIQRKKNHFKLTSPSGAIFFMTATPSDHRSTKNFLALLRRSGEFPE